VDDCAAGADADMGEGWGEVLVHGAGGGVLFGGFDVDLGGAGGGHFCFGVGWGGDGEEGGKERYGCSRSEKGSTDSSASSVCQPS